MGLVILGFIGFILATLIGLAWAVVWIAFALFWLVWPIVLLVVAGMAWRRQANGSGLAYPSCRYGASSVRRFST